MTQEDRPSVEELAALGLYDAKAADAADRLRLLRMRWISARPSRRSPVRPGCARVSGR